MLTWNWHTGIYYTHTHTLHTHTYNTHLRILSWPTVAMFFLKRILNKIKAIKRDQFILPAGVNVHIIDGGFANNMIRSLKTKLWFLNTCKHIKVQKLDTHTVYTCTCRQTNKQSTMTVWSDLWKWFYTHIQFCNFENCDSIYGKAILFKFDHSVV